MDIVYRQGALADIDAKIEELKDDIGKEITDKAKQYVPVDTGELRDSINVQADDPVNKEIYIGSTVEYAIYIEMGTTKMSPQPYLRPALDETMADVDKNQVEGFKPLV